MTIHTVIWVYVHQHTNLVGLFKYIFGFVQTVLVVSWQRAFFMTGWLTVGHLSCAVRNVAEPFAIFEGLVVLLSPCSCLRVEEVLVE